MASESGPSSKVVLCTDGKANIGVGSLNVSDFYKEIGGISKEIGISVSIISIEGQDCRLDALNLVTSQTEGDKLLTQFSNIMQDEIISTCINLSNSTTKCQNYYPTMTQLTLNILEKWPDLPHFLFNKFSNLMRNFYLWELISLILRVFIFSLLLLIEVSSQ